MRFNPILGMPDEFPIGTFVNGATWLHHSKLFVFRLQWHQDSLLFLFHCAFLPYTDVTEPEKLQQIKTITREYMKEPEQLRKLKILSDILKGRTSSRFKWLRG